MLKKIISFFILIFVCVCIFGNGASAKERKFKKQDTKYIYNENKVQCVYKMYVSNTGKVQYIWAERPTMKHWYTKFHRESIEGKKIKAIGSFKDNSIWHFDDVKVSGDKSLTIRVKGKKERAVIREYDKKGKKIFTYIDDNEKRSIGPFLKGWDDGKSIYYTHIKLRYDENLYVFNTRCINKKSKKAKDMNSFKVDMQDIDEVVLRNFKIEKKKIFVLCNEKINVYSLNGKLLNTFKLPEGERTIRVYIDPPDVGDYLTFNHFSVYGDYIYYCNRNGIYRLNMKEKGGFKLYYNAEGDEYFGSEYGAEDICVKDENTIYMMIRDVTAYDPTKIVRYSRIR